MGGTQKVLGNYFQVAFHLNYPSVWIYFMKLYGYNEDKLVHQNIFFCWLKVS